MNQIPPLTEQNLRKPEPGHKKVERSEQSEEEDEFIEVELESDEELKQSKARKEPSSYCNSFPSSSESEKFQKAIDSKKFAAQSTLNLFRNLASMPTAAGRSTMTAFTPYAMNCQLNNALQYAEQ